MQLSKEQLEASFKDNDNETLEEFAIKCIKNGWLYTARYHEGKPVLERLQ